MSKIAEQKALETYPEIEGSETYFDGDYICTKPIDLNKQRRQGYIKGYEQAMQDVKEFIYEYFYVHPHDCHLAMYESDTPLENDLDDFWEQLEKYLEGK